MINTQQFIQSSEYRFPYHYIPNINEYGVPSLARSWPYAASWLAAFDLIREEILRIEIQNNHTIHNVLDLGCGDGALINLLSQTVDDSVHRSFLGVDYDPKALAWADIFKNSVRADFLLLNILEQKHFDLPNADLLTCIEVIEHIPLDDLDRFIEASARLISNSGYAIFTVPHSNSPVQSKHFQHFTFKSLEATLSPYFNIIDMRGFGRLCSARLRLLSKIQFYLNFELYSPMLAKIYVGSFKRTVHENLAKRIMCIAQKR